MNTWLSLVPPLLAIATSLITKQVIFSLSLGVFVGALVLTKFSLFESFILTMERLVLVVSNPDTVKILLFSLLIGAVVALLEKSGAMSGFLEMVTKRKWINTKRKAQGFTVALGSLLFLEGSMSILTVGTVAKPFFKKLKLSKEKLAYLCDSTCAPVAVLIPLNGWGAYLLTQLKLGGVASPLETLLQAIPFFIYPAVAYFITLLVTFIAFDIKPMKTMSHEASYGVAETSDEPGRGQAINPFFFIAPMITLVGSLFGFMIYTGRGEILMGDGAASLLFSIVLTLILMFFLYTSSGKMSLVRFFDISLDGMKRLLDIVVILVFAFLINDICRELQTGVFLSSWIGPQLSLWAVPCVIFIVSALMAFATGTSWGTFAIMLSVALPLATELQLSIPLILGAVVSGGVWGDHCSPISDTTVLSALAADCELMDHVRTQLPYAMIGGIVTGISFLILGVIT